ncbi:MAG: YeeE/YedE family protein [ANME-2 cluster archaeon]|nr:YeeE/YedE family protein [ANME-2 cluster archaeon]
MRYLPPWVTGLLLAVLNTLLFVYFNRPWGIGGAEMKLVAAVENRVIPSHVSSNLHFQTFTPEVNWFVMFIIGIVIGAFISANLGRDFKVRVPQERKWLAYTFMGGMLMGLGERIGNGCNVGHILSGVPQFSIASLVGGVFIVVGAYAGSKIIVRLV